MSVRGVMPVRPCHVREAVSCRTSCLGHVMSVRPCHVHEGLSCS